MLFNFFPRDHIFQLYRGQLTFFQDVFVSPQRLVVSIYMQKKIVLIIPSQVQTAFHCFLGFPWLLVGLEHVFVARLRSISLVWLQLYFSFGWLDLSQILCILTYLLILLGPARTLEAGDPTYTSRIFVCGPLPHLHSLLMNLDSMRAKALFWGVEGFQRKQYHCITHAREWKVFPCPNRKHLLSQLILIPLELKWSKACGKIVIHPFVCSFLTLFNSFLSFFREEAFDIPATRSPT